MVNDRHLEYSRRVHCNVVTSSKLAYISTHPLKMVCCGLETSFSTKLGVHSIDRRPSMGFIGYTLWTRMNAVCGGEFLAYVRIPWTPFCVGTGDREWVLPDRPTCAQRKGRHFTTCIGSLTSRIHNSDVNVTPYLFKYIPRAQMQEDTFNCVRTLSGRLERERQT